MRARNHPLLAAGILLLAVACTGAPEPPPGPVADPRGLVSLELDDGRPWSVDDHTRRALASMNALVDSTAPVVSVDDARELAADLERELGALIEGCTMTGTAHDRLHDVLAALFPRVNTLKSGEDPAALREAQLDVESLLEATGRAFR